MHPGPFGSAIGIGCVAICDFCVAVELLLSRRTQLMSSDLNRIKVQCFLFFMSKARRVNDMDAYSPIAFDPYHCSG